jgi:hypothetical protein
MKTSLEKTIAYFYNEHYGSYFGVESYKLKEDGTFDCGIASGVYCEEKMKANNIPYMGVKTENKDIQYL